MTALMTPTAGPHREGVPAPTLLGVDHLEWWVGNARAMAGFLQGAFGFGLEAHAGPETGVRDRVSYVLVQGDIRFVVTSSLDPDSEISDHVRRHGDSVRTVAFGVPDVTGAHDEVRRRGALDAEPPVYLRDTDGVLGVASMAVYGDVRFAFVERDGYHGTFGPLFEPTDHPRPVGPDVGLRSIDHVVANVADGDLRAWVDHHERVLGLRQMVHFDERAISTEFSALRSTVMTNDAGVTLPINEPALGRRRSQIEEYLDAHHGPGVQHVAMSTPDIVATVRALRARGVRFLRVPRQYYDDARRRLGDLDLDWAALAELGVLVDRDEHGHLLQLFTETVTDRPTVFFEVIQRAGAVGFGEGNFKALFEAIEREQERRGNL